MGESYSGKPPEYPDMPDEEPKVLAMEESKLQNSFLKQREASFGHDLDRQLANGALQF